MRGVALGFWFPRGLFTTYYWCTVRENSSHGRAGVCDEVQPADPTRCQLLRGCKWRRRREGERERGREGEMEGGRGEMEFGRERERGATKWLCCGCWVASLRCSYSVHTCVFRAAQNSAGVYIHLRMVNSKSIEMGNGWIYILTCSL